MSSSKQLFKPNNNQVVAKSKGRLQVPPSCTVLSLWLPQGKLSFLEEQRLPCREWKTSRQAKTGDHTVLKGKPHKVGDFTFQPAPYKTAKGAQKLKNFSTGGHCWVK